jgi:hypothetical protein
MGDLLEGDDRPVAVRSHGSNRERARAVTRQERRPNREPIGSIACDGDLDLALQADGPPEPSDEQVVRGYHERSAQRGAIGRSVWCAAPDTSTG